MEDNSKQQTDVKDDMWSVTFEGYDPKDEGRRESICALGNGYMVTRAAALHTTADGVHYPGAYRAGLYNRVESQVEENNLENESLVNLPNWLWLTFRIDKGHWFSIDDVEILSYRQTLDLHWGVMRRDIRFCDAQGRKTRLHEVRLVSMAKPHLAGFRVEVVAENWSGELNVHSGIDGNVLNDLDGDVPYAERHIEVSESGPIPEGGVWLKCRTTQSGVEVALATRTRMGLDKQQIQGEWRDGIDLKVTEEFHGWVSEGNTVAIEKVVALYTSRDPAISECGEAARKAVNLAPEFSELLQTHERSWELLWGRCHVDLGKSETLLAARLNLYHILQTVSPHTADLDVGIPSRSWQEGYHGQIFWDELFVFPLLTFRIPALARELLLYRYRRLDEARLLARQNGYGGAMFPWRSASTGGEETPALQPYPPSGHWLRDDTRLQRHIGSAVAHSVWYYTRATGDTEFMSDYGAELFLEIARFWVSIATHNDQSGRYEICGVVGPDEYHTAYPGAEHPGINNNAYTNLMAAWTITKGLEVLGELTPSRREELCHTLALSQAELEHWDAVSRKLFIPFYDDGFLEQFQGFHKLKELDLKEFGEHHGSTRTDWALEAQGDSVNNYQIAKQADTVTLLFLLPQSEIDSLITRLGYRFERTNYKCMVDFYLKRTRHESSLSKIVYAGALAQLDNQASWNLFEQSQFPDLSAVRSEGAAQGVHLGAMAGTVYLLQHHYLGLSAEKNALRVQPAIPKGLGRLFMKLLYRHNELTFEGTSEKLTVTSASWNVEIVQIFWEDTSYELEPGKTLNFNL